jgi:hypothetical protein
VTGPTDVDLSDHGPARRPAHRAPRWAVLVAAVAGVIGGVAVDAAAQPAPPPAGDRVLASLQLREVVLADVPVAILDLSVQNAADLPLTVRRARLAGGGLEPTAVPVGRYLEAEAAATDRLEVPLQCTGAGGPAATGRPTAVLELDAPGGTVPVVPLGAAATAGGLCAVADATLPAGWRTPARAISWGSTPAGGLRLALTGLGADAVEVTGAAVGGADLAPASGPAAVRGGAAEVTLRAPSAGCAAAAAGDAGAAVPTGVTLFVQDGAGSHAAYVPLGTGLAAWLLDAGGIGCPSGGSPSSAS